MAGRKRIRVPRVKHTPVRSASPAEAQKHKEYVFIVQRGRILKPLGKQLPPLAGEEPSHNYIDQ